MTVPTKLLLLFGGRSTEHQISCLSARNVVEALDADRYDVTAVGITKEGRWTLVERIPEPEDGGLPAVPDDGPTVALVRTREGPRLVRVEDDGRPAAALGPVDVCLPVLHGPYGEDGTVQGLLASYDVPYAGADVASSAIGIDKRQMKYVFTARGLPQTSYRTVRRADWERDPDAVLDDLDRALGYPVFTKPARQGSSIGIRRCADRDGTAAGIGEAFGYDRVAIVEQGLDDVREIECGVIGNATVEVTRPGETVHAGEFYDFEAKYVSHVDLECPADLPDDVTRRTMEYARDAFLAIGCRGMARVDFFYVERTGEVLVNEINTIPGMTSQSMFWVVWEAEGLSRPALLDRIIALALEASEAEARFAP